MSEYREVRNPNWKPEDEIRSRILNALLGSQVAAAGMESPDETERVMAAKEWNYHAPEYNAAMRELKEMG